MILKANSRNVVGLFSFLLPYFLSNSMSLFEKAIPVVLKQEGGFVNNPQDPGGATNYGISLRYLQKLEQSLGDINADGEIDIEDIKQLTKEKASEIYKKLWWDKYQYGRITSQELATKLFSFSVNMGATQAHKLFQRSIVKCGFNLDADGSLGNITFAAANEINADFLLSVFKLEAISFYLSLYEVNKAARQQFIIGWIKRAME